MTPDEYREETHKISKSGDNSISGQEGLLAEHVLDASIAMAKIADTAKKNLFHGKPPHHSDYTDAMAQVIRSLDGLSRILFYDSDYGHLEPVTGIRSDLILHTLGLIGESGEVAEHTREYSYDYGQLKIKETLVESGDVIWYLDRLLGHLGCTIEDAMLA